jgi:hypothetical protein
VASLPLMAGEGPWRPRATIEPMSASRPIEAKAPDVLIVGGFMTYPPAYLALRGRLLARGAARVSIAPLWPHDWLAGAARSLAPLVTRTALAARRLHDEGEGGPILIVGHSAGGVLARLVTSPESFHGCQADLAEIVGAIVTLGSPHKVVAEPWRGLRAGGDASRFLEATVPGAFFAPRIGYLTVGSSLVPAAGPTAGFEPWWAGQAYSLLLGADGRTELGDGMVPLAAAHLDGARQITFEDVRHGHLGAHWYGDERVVDRWWPEALETWRGALDARATAAERAPEGTLSAPAAFDPSGPVPISSPVAGWSSGSSSGS